MDMLACCLWSRPQTADLLSVQLCLVGDSKEAAEPRIFLPESYPTGAFLTDLQVKICMLPGEEHVIKALITDLIMVIMHFEQRR